MRCFIAASAAWAAASLRSDSIARSRLTLPESLIILFFPRRGHDGQVQGANDAQGGRATIRHLESRGAEVAQRRPPAFFPEGSAGKSPAIRRRHQCHQERYRGAAEVGSEGIAQP